MTVEVLYEVDCKMHLSLSVDQKSEVSLLADSLRNEIVEQENSDQGLTPSPCFI